MGNCCCGGESKTPYYLVVQTLTERNLIPCSERKTGMIVTVVGNDNSFNQYMLMEGDPCNNDSWKPYNTAESLVPYFGHVTVDGAVSSPVTTTILNQNYPLAQQGFKVTYIQLNSTFMKIEGDNWVLTNYIII